MKRALITGITGQTAAYLARLLLENGYEVHGAYRRASSLNAWRLQELGIRDSVKMVALELLEYSNIVKVLEAVRPTEVYNLAAQSFVAASFEQPIYTSESNALGPLRLLEAIRGVDPDIRFYQASTSEMFGKTTGDRQSEETLFHPRSPYGVSKLHAHWSVVNYREAYGLYTASGILFNHESPLRGLEFVTRKITAGLAEIRHERRDCISLGNLEARRDWGFAGDYVRGMWAMLQQSEGADYVLGTGETYSVRQFVEIASQRCGFDLEWQGEGLEEHGIDRKSGRAIVRINPDFWRPAEVDYLCADAGNAKERLGWTPEVDFAGLVEMMAAADLERAARGPILL